MQAAGTDDGAEHDGTLGRGDVAWLLLIVGLLLLGTTHNPHLPRSVLPNLDPLPDSVEYAIGARRLAHLEQPVLAIGAARLPIKATLGYPLLLAGLSRVFGEDLQGLHDAARALGALCAALLYLLLRRADRDPLVARLGALFFATNPLAWTFSGLLMKEMTSALCAVAATLLLLRARRTGGVADHAALGAALAFAGLVKPPNLLFVAPCVAYLLATRAEGRPSPRALAALAGALLLGVAALALHNRLLYGGVLASRYEDGLAPANLLGNASRYLPSLFLARGGSSLWIEGPFYGVVIPLLGLGGVVALARERRRAALLFGAVATAGPLLLYCAWWYFDVRFFFPLFPLFFACAALGAARLAHGRPPAARRALLAAVALAYVLQPLGASGTIAGQYLRPPREGPPPRNYLHVQEVNAFMARAGATRERCALLCSLDLVYHEWLSNGRYTLLPLDEGQRYAQVPLGGLSVRDACAERLAAGVEVYASDFQASDHGASIEGLRGRFDLEVVDEYLDGSAHLYRVRARRP